MAKPKRKITHPKKRAFLAAYAEVGNISQAADLVNMERRMHYTWLEKDENYVLAFEAAKEQAADRLEQEARRRAVKGVEEPVWHKGEQCGTVQKYSDTLLIFLMKGAMPEKYKERGRYEHTGKGGGPIEVKRYDGLSDEEIDKILEEKLAALGKAEGTDPD